MEKAIEAFVKAREEMQELYLQKLENGEFHILHEKTEALEDIVRVYVVMGEIEQHICYFKHMNTIFSYDSTPPSAILTKAVDCPKKFKEAILASANRLKEEE